MNEVGNSVMIPSVSRLIRYVLGDTLSDNLQVTRGIFRDASHIVRGARL